MARAPGRGHALRDPGGGTDGIAGCRGDRSADRRGAVRRSVDRAVRAGERAARGQRRAGPDRGGPGHRAAAGAREAGGRRRPGPGGRVRRRRLPLHRGFSRDSHGPVIQRPPGHDDGPRRPVGRREDHHSAATGPFLRCQLRCRAPRWGRCAGSGVGCRDRPRGDRVPGRLSVRGVDSRQRAAGAP